MTPASDHRAHPRGRRAYGGQSYEIDLTEEHASELDTLLARYVEHSRKVEEVQPQPQPRQRRARKTQGEHRGPEELGAIAGRAINAINERRGTTTPTRLPPVSIGALVFTRSVFIKAPGADA